jgi:hypothetical protein
MIRATGFAVSACAMALAACSTVPPGAPLEGSAAADAVTCRDVLEPPSNVPREVCQTGAQWAEYERARERAARETLRQMTGGPVTGPTGAPVNVPF